MSLNVPGTSIGDTNQDPTGLTGQTGTGLQQKTRIGFLAPGFGASQNPIPTDPVMVGTRAMGYGPGKGLGVSLNDSTTYGQAQNLPAQWYSSDPGFYKQFIAKAVMYKLPGASADMGLPEAGSVWDNLLQTAINLNKAGGKKTDWTPWDVLDSYNRPAGSLGTRKVGDWLIDNATGEKVKYVGPKSKTTSQTAIDLSNPEQVQAIATQTLTQMIGRAPTDKELAQFKATLNGYEKSHPETTTTTDTYDDMGNVSASNVVHSGGVTDAARQTVLGEGVQKTKEYGKYQAGTTYFNSLMQMIGGG
jgi:hypothetical protein